MGFFSDLKEDLSQAVNEMMPEEVKVKADESDVSLDEMLKNIDEFRLPEEMEAETAEAVQPEPMAQETAEEFTMAGTEPEAAVMPEPDVYGGFTTEEGTEEQEGAAADVDMEKMLAELLEQHPDSEPEPRNEVVQEETLQVEVMQDEVMQEETPQEEVMQEETPQEKAWRSETEQNKTIVEESKGEEEEMDMESMELVTDREVSDETSVITEGMTITGDMTTQGSIDVIGTVNGNIDALGKLNITGHVNGNSKAAEIYAESAKINGEIVSEGAVKIGVSSVIIGNITATSAAIAGAVKGDIDVRGPVILDASAIVMGNIKSKSVQINNGAVIEGMCSQCYADVSPTSFFDEYKPEGVRKAKAKQGEQRDK